MGDLQLNQLEEQIVKAAAPIARVAWEESDQGALPTIVYTPGVASAHFVCKTINDLAGKEIAVSVDADTPGWQRKEFLEDFGKRIRFIVNCQIYTEGLDVPLARCIVIARMTQSKSLYIQMAGRGGRPEAGIGELETVTERLEAIAKSSKPFFKLVDITGKAGKHSLVSAVDALSGKSVDEVVRKLADKILKSSPGTTLDEAVKLAKAEAAKKEAEEIARSAAKIAAAAAKAAVRTRRETFDPFARLGVEYDAAISDAEGNLVPEWLQQQPTPEQLLWLRENKLPEEGVTRGKCVLLQKQARQWKKAGLASFKQRRILARAKISVDVPSAVAQRVIGTLIEANWNASKVRGKIDRIISEGRTVGEEG